MWQFFILLVFLSYADAEKVSYLNYKVYRIIAENNTQLTFLQKLESNNNFSYWLNPRSLKQPFHLMVKPSEQETFIKNLDGQHLTYETLIDNVQELIDDENLEDRITLRMPSIFSFRLNRYHTLTEIYNWFDTLAHVYPSKVKVVVGGRSYEGRDIKGVKLSSGADKRSVFIEGGIHAREWISPATVLYLIHWFLTSKSPEVQRLATAYNWYFFPIFNPDGYVYTRTTDRLWRKNRSKNTDSDCIGTDLNRNWDSAWDYFEGSSSDPCSENYRGAEPFSEVESRTLYRYIQSLKPELSAYISFHSYGQILLFPYSHSRHHFQNYEKNYEIGKKAVKALSKKYQTTYKIGIAAETLYKTASGSTMDWATSTLGLPMAFTYELPPSIEKPGRNGFFVPTKKIKESSEEVLDSLIAMFDDSPEVLCDVYGNCVDNPALYEYSVE